MLPAEQPGQSSVHGVEHGAHLDQVQAGKARACPSLVWQNVFMVLGEVVIQADLPTVLVVSVAAVSALIFGPLVRRAWSGRRTRRLADTVAQAVVQALNDRDTRRAGPNDNSGG